MVTATTRINETSYTADLFSGDSGFDWIGKNRLIRLTSGVILSAYGRGDDHNDTDGHPQVLRVSADSGATWAAKNTWHDGTTAITGFPTGPSSAGDVLDAVFAVAPSGRTYYYQSEGARGGVNRYGTWAWYSDNDGLTWTVAGQVTFSAHTANACKIWDWEQVGTTTYFTVQEDPGANMSEPFSVQLYKATTSNLAALTWVSEISNTTVNANEAAIGYLQDEDEFVVILRYGNLGSCGIIKSASVSSLGDTWGSITDGAQLIGDVTSPIMLRDSFGGLWLGCRLGIIGTTQQALFHSIDGTYWAGPYIPGDETGTFEDNDYVTMCELADGTFYGQAGNGTNDVMTIDGFTFSVSRRSEAVRVLSARCRTSGGTQTFKVPGFGTPSAAIIMLSNGNVLEAASTDGLNEMSVGFTDFTSQNMCLFSCASANNDGVRQQRDDNTNLLFDPVALAIKASGTVAAVDGGITITWTTTPADAYLMTVYLFSDECLVKCGVLTLGNQNVAVPVTTTGVNPAIVFAMTSSGTINNSTRTDGQRFSFGVSNGTTQRNISYGSTALDANGITQGTAGAAASVAGSGLAWSASIESMTSGGFTAYARGGNSTSAVHYLAIELPPRVLAAIADIDLPTAAGAKSVSSLGFTESPAAAIICTGHNTARDSVSTTDTLQVSIAASDGMSQNSIGIASRPYTSSPGYKGYSSLQLDWHTTGTHIYAGKFKSFSNASSGTANLSFSATSGVVRKAFGVFFASTPVATAKNMLLLGVG